VVLLGAILIGKTIPQIRVGGSYLVVTLVTMILGQMNDTECGSAQDEQQACGAYEYRPETSGRNMKPALLASIPGRPG